jgi:hypothetical protein
MRRALIAVLLADSVTGPLESDTSLVTGRPAIT